MQTLFGNDPSWPDGFRYFPDFISEEEEQQLIGTMHSLTLKSFLFHGFEAKRKVASYGYDYHFDSRSISKGEPIPEGFHFLLEKVAAHLQRSPEEFAEVLATEYPPGSVINWHRDAPPFGMIAGISLATDCIFRLRPYATENRTRQSIRSFPVQRRSLYVMEGASRDEWEHSIRPVARQRFSITLRTLRSA